MADRVSTIRFKAEGTQEVASKIEELSRAIVRQQRQAAQSTKIASQMVLGGNPDSAIMIKAAKADFDQLDRLRQQRDQEERVLATAHINQVAENAASEVGIRDKAIQDQAAKSNKIATAQIDAERSARTAALKADILAREKAAQDQFRIESESLTQREMQAAESNKIATSQIDKERDARAAALKADILGRERATMEQFKLEARAAEETERNAARVARVSEQSAAKIRRLQEGDGGGGIGGALSGFGGKMVLAHAAGTAAGDILGDQHGGREIGAVVGAAMFGGPEVAAAVAGIELIGAAIRANRESAEAARKSAQGYISTLGELTQTWSGMATSLVKQGSFADAMDKEMKRAADATVKHFQEAGKIVQEGPGLGDVLQMARGKSPAFLQNLAAEAHQIAVEQTVSAAARLYRDQEYGDHARDQQGIVTAEQGLSATAGMRPGLLKQQAELSATINVEETKRLANNREQVAQAKAAVTQATIYSALAQQQADHPPPGSNPTQILAMKAAAQEAQNALRDAQMAQANLPGQQGREKQESDAKHQAEAASLKIQADMQLEEQGVKTSQAQVAATKDGYAKTAAVRDLAFAEEEKRAADHGAAMVKLVKDMHTAMRAETAKENQESIQAAMAPFDTTAAGAVGDRARADLKARGASDDQVSQIDNGKYLLQIDEARVNEASALRVITLEEAAIERALIADKDPAHKAAIIAAVKAREEAANADEIAKSDLSTKQSALDIAYEEHKITTADYEMQKEMAADRRAQENPAVAAALQRRVAAEQEVATVRDIQRYRHEAMSTELDYRVKMHQVSERDADIQRMILADRRAQEKGPAGDRIRAEIVNLANLRQKLRDTEILNVGESSSRYESGHVNLNAVNQNHSYGFFRHNAQGSGSSRFESGKTDLNRIASILERIEQRGGLN